MWSCDIHTTLPLQIGKEGYAAAPPITVGELFRKTRDTFPDNVALSWKDGGEWKRMTYVEYYNECVRAAKSFLKVSDLYVYLSARMYVCHCCMSVCISSFKNSVYVDHAARLIAGHQHYFCPIYSSVLKACTLSLFLVLTHRNG